MVLVPTICIRRRPPQNEPIPKARAVYTAELPSMHRADFLDRVIGQPPKSPVALIACNGSPTLTVLIDSYTTRLPMLRIAQCVDPALHVTFEQHDHATPAHTHSHFLRANAEQQQ